jgi:hypothetical protein
MAGMMIPTRNFFLGTFIPSRRNQCGFPFFLSGGIFKPREQEITWKEGMNMLTKGGYQAEAGTYWNMMNGERVDLEQAGALPGDAGTKYLKAPMAVMLAAAPVLGLIFAVFLPFIGIVMSVAQAGRRLAGSVRGAAADSASFGWRPIEAYLAGRKGKKEAREKKDTKKAGKQ